MRPPRDVIVVDVTGKRSAPLRFEELERVADDLAEVVGEVQAGYGGRCGGYLVRVLFLPEVDFNLVLKRYLHISIYSLLNGKNYAQIIWSKDL